MPELLPTTLAVREYLLGRQGHTAHDLLPTDGSGSLEVFRVPGIAVSVLVNIVSCHQPRKDPDSESQADPIVDRTTARAKESRAFGQGFAHGPPVGFEPSPKGLSFFIQRRYSGST